ncbi:Response regulator receiver domain-containing protein [Mameliella alba]|nr:response regulator receiver domain-containing protein [Mameliella alba]SDC76101.1 Response regulator receiver domain-containing protein [Mameliella alba]
MESSVHLTDATKILVIEDNGPFLAALADTLEMFGYAVEQLSDPARALNRVASAPGFDILVVDLHLGALLSGTEVAQAARQSAPDLPVILLTGGQTDGPPHTLASSELVMKTDGPMALRDALDRASAALAD